MPLLPRAHLFEFNDRDWVPESLRDTIVETLSRSLDWGGFLRPLAPVIDDFLSAAGTREVLDLCAGAGGPAVMSTPHTSPRPHPRGVRASSSTRFTIFNLS